MNIDIVQLHIVSIDTDRQIVVFRTHESERDHETLFAYMHETKQLVFFDTNESDDFDPTETSNLDDVSATDYFSVCSDDNLASCIASTIYMHYKHVDRSESYCELTALKSLDFLLVKH